MSRETKAAYKAATGDLALKKHKAATGGRAGNMSESRDITAQDAQTAAQLAADVGVEHIADVYAKAMLDVAEKAGEVEPMLADFDALVGEVLNASPRLDAVLGSALVSPDEKDGILDRVFGGRVSPLFLRFLKVVSRHGRLDCLRAIHRRAHMLDDQRGGRVRARFTTAAPLDPALGQRIAESLRALLGGQPVIEWATDPELIGGAVLRIGDTVYDGSVASQLNLLRQQIIDRSVHEIQSRRDRFRN